MHRPTGFAYLISLDSHQTFASNHYGDCGLNSSNQWGWIADMVAHQFECSPDDVHCIETDDGDQFTVDGKAVAYLANEKPAPSVAYLQAAE